MKFPKNFLENVKKISKKSWVSVRQILRKIYKNCGNNFKENVGKFLENFGTFTK